MTDSSGPTQSSLDWIEEKKLLARVKTRARRRVAVKRLILGPVLCAAALLTVAGIWELNTSGPTTATSSATPHQQKPLENNDRSLIPPQQAPCPSGQTSPTVISGQFCGPLPRQGNGNGVSGSCSGSETSPPCGQGVEINQYYAYTLIPGCTTVLFDGDVWTSDLPIPSTEQSPRFVWMLLDSTGEVHGVSNSASITFVRESSNSAPTPEPVC